MWTVNQWFLTKKIQFEDAILQNIRTRYEHHRKNIVACEQIYEIEKDPELLNLIDLSNNLLNAVILDEQLVKRVNLPFRNLRALNKRYLGTEISDDSFGVMHNYAQERDLRGGQPVIPVPRNQTDDDEDNANSHIS